jgi:hypothetical protein
LRHRDLPSMVWLRLPESGETRRSRGREALAATQHQLVVGTLQPEAAAAPAMPLHLNHWPVSPSSTGSSTPSEARVSASCSPSQTSERTAPRTDTWSVSTPDDRTRISPISQPPPPVLQRHPAPRSGRGRSNALPGGGAQLGTPTPQTARRSRDPLRTRQPQRAGVLARFPGGRVTTR